MVKLDTKKLQADRKSRSKSWRVNLGRYLDGWEVSDHVIDDWRFWAFVTWYLKYSKATIIVFCLVTAWLIFS